MMSRHLFTVSRMAATFVFTLNPALFAVSIPLTQLSYWVWRFSLKRRIVLPRKRFVNQFPDVKRALTCPFSKVTSKTLSLTPISLFAGASPPMPRKCCVNDTFAICSTHADIVLPPFSALSTHDAAKGYTIFPRHARFLGFWYILPYFRFVRRWPKAPPRGTLGEYAVSPRSDLRSPASLPAATRRDPAFTKQPSPQPFLQPSNNHAPTTTQPSFVANPRTIPTQPSHIRDSTTPTTKQRGGFAAH